MSEKKKYNTKQRDDIMRCIDSFGDEHFTASELAARLADNGVTVGQATVYRMIDRLEEDGEIRKYVIDGSTASCYQRVTKGSHTHSDCHLHFHLKCEKCGKLLHTECEELSKIAAHVLADHGFSIDSSKTVFYGICGDCRQKQTAVQN